MKKMNFKSENETKVTCPKCGTEFAIADKTHISVGVVIGKDAGLGTIHPKVANEETSSKLPNKAAERIEALRDAGVDVSNLFAMMGANGGEYVASQKDGVLSIIADDDPIYKIILEQGSVPNGQLFRRWVMSQMFRMLYRENNKRYYFALNITEQIRVKGYDYMWKQTEDELWAQRKMKQNGDMVNFKDRNRWFNHKLVLYMMQDYSKQLRKHINTLAVKKCKGVPYVRLCGENIFLEDIEKKVFEPIDNIIWAIKVNTLNDIWFLVNKFNKIRKVRGWNPVPCREWIDAYKGAGAFFTMQNMIRFHGCRVYEAGVKASKNESYQILCDVAEKYKNEGWRLIGFLRKLLKDNNVDIAKKMAEWRKRK